MQSVVYGFYSILKSLKIEQPTDQKIRYSAYFTKYTVSLLKKEPTLILEISGFNFTELQNGVGPHPL